MERWRRRDARWDADADGDGVRPERRGARTALSALLPPVAALLAVGAGAGGAAAQAVPSPDEVLGYGIGERFTAPDRIAAYAERLASASPRVRLERYGETPEGRPLLLLTVAREDLLPRLDRVRERNARLLDPGLPESEAAAIARDNPAIVWFSYGIHGDEAASPEAALWTAYDLASGAPGTEGLLDSLVVLIDPMVNPDGRNRYVSWYRSVRGVEPNPEPGTAEHDPPWPDGRTNHYLFDLNRDWAWAVQPETRARLRRWNRWNPQVHVDFHEMSWRSTYFFFPATPPINPLYPESTLRWGRYFGDALARAFDRRGWLYFTGESYDLFYPGYGDSWPSLVGAIGMTYEQAGSGGAGLAVRRPDGSILTLRDRATHHRISGLTTLRAAADRKTELLEEFAAFHRALRDVDRSILLVPDEEGERTAGLVRLLRDQGIRVERAESPFRATAEPHPGYPRRGRFPDGTYRVPLGQSRGLLARTLLQAEIPFDTTAEQFSYDLTAWSVPYAHGVEAHSVSGVPGGAFVEVGIPALEPHPLPGGPRGGTRPETRPGGAGRAGAEGARGAPVAPAAGRPDGPYGWLVRPGFESAGPVYRYLARGGLARAVERPFETEGVRWPPGTVFLPAMDSAAAWLSEAGLADRATAVGSGRTPVGVDLGTRSALRLEAARIGVATGPGVSPSAYGEVWFLLDRLVGIPFDALAMEELDRADLDPYDVLVVPSADRPEEDVREALEAWVRDGGTLLALEDAARWTGEDLAGVEPTIGDTAASEEERVAAGLRTRRERRIARWRDAVTGVVLPAALDPEHPLAWGSGAPGGGDRTFVLHRNDLAFTPAEGHETVAHFPAGVRELSGVLSEEKRRELEETSWLVTTRVGAGRVILFADDPLFRLIWRATFPLFTNALLYGPAM